MLKVIQDLRLEGLIDRLADSLRRHPPAPADLDCVVVESLGMARHLPQQLARRMGAVAAIDFPFAARFLWDRLFRPAFPDLPERSPYAPEALAWRIAAILPELLADETFAPLRRALEREEDPRALHELAQRLAALYDQYLVYRPSWLLAWEGDHEAAERSAGGPPPAEALPHARWQRLLWRSLAPDRPPHRARLQAELLRRLDAGEVDQALPARLRLFALHSLPASWLQLLAAIARRRDVEIHLLNPSREYWSHLETPCRGRRRLSDKLDEHREDRPRLLAANGRELAQWIDQLLEAGAQFEDPPALPSTAPRTRLEALQHSLHELDPLLATTAPGPDPSLQFHACHSLTRQLETLHDCLCALFEERPDLRPDEILVLLPDLEAARPSIEAVFGAQPEALRIHWRLLGAAPWSGSLSRALADLLALAEGRWTLAEVLAPLECPAVRRRLSLSPQDPPALRRLLEAAGIRWGLDAQDRRRRDLPAEAAHSWKAGLDRLLLGQAMESAEPVAGRQPLPGVEGEALRLLEACLTWIEALEPLLPGNLEPRSPAAWTETLLELLDAVLLADDDDEREATGLREILLDFERGAAEGGWKIPLPFSVVARRLRAALDGAAGIHGGGFDGRLTFAPMLAARAIPARVIALLGMDDGVFPRPRPRDELDLALHRPLFGDRQPRDQDRAQFLDAVLSARESLLLFWNGRELRENAKLPPSPVIDELLEELGPRGPGVVEHPLQPFSPRHFDGDDPALFSYDEEQLAGARRLQQARLGGAPPARPRFLRALAPPPPEQELALAELTRFFANPARGLLAGRLGWRLPAEERPVDGVEPFALTPFDAAAIRREIGQAIIDGSSEDRAIARVVGADRLGWGELGRQQLRPLLAHVHAVIQRRDAIQSALGAPLPALGARREIAGQRLAGPLGERHEHGRVIAAWGRIGGIDLGGHWLGHLWYQLVAPEGANGITAVVARDGEHVFGPVPDAEALLAQWLEARREGLARWLPWLPGISPEIAVWRSSSGEPATLADLVAGDWSRGREWRLGDPWLRLVMDGGDPFRDPQTGPEILALALRLGVPLANALEGGRS